MTLTTTIFMYDKKHYECTEQYKEVTGRMTIMLPEVEKWAEVVKDDDNEEIHPERCCVYFKSGDSVIIGMGYDEFDAIMVSFAKKLFLMPHQLQ
jgi:hypothetical protein